MNGVRDMKNGGKKMSRTALGVLCTVLGGVFWGLSGSCGQFLFENYGVQSIWLTAVRMLFAGIVLTVWGLFRKRGAMAGIWKDKKGSRYRDCTQSGSLWQEGHFQWWQFLSPRKLFSD